MKENFKEKWEQKTYKGYVSQTILQLLCCGVWLGSFLLLLFYFKVNLLPALGFSFAFLVLLLAIYVFFRKSA